MRIMTYIWNKWLVKNLFSLVLACFFNRLEETDFNFRVYIHYVMKKLRFPYRFLNFLNMQNKHRTLLIAIFMLIFRVLFSYVHLFGIRTVEFLLYFAVKVLTFREFHRGKFAPAQTHKVRVRRLWSFLEQPSHKFLL